ncbi:MAG: LamG-like jellyroll fold domain-containing protein [Saprospiraceae bacterium]
MKSILLTALLSVAVTFLSLAQNAGSTIRINASEVTVAHDPIGSLNAADAHTLEIWFKADDVIADQKLVSKVDNSFTSGYILGIENETLKYELFNSAGVKQELIAGTIQANQWTHVAATYQKGGKIRLYVNGVLAGEIDDDDTTIAGNTSPFIVGTSSWDIGALDYTGEIDEVRWWHGELSETTINNWMVRNVDTDSHPNKIQLQLYHKYDNGTGSDVIDHSNQTTNTGTFPGQTWMTSTVPFKGTQWFAVTGPSINGVWVGHDAYTLNTLTIEGIGLMDDQSAVLESNNETVAGSICGHPIPAGIESVSCLFYYIISQENPTVSFNFDLSNYDLTNTDVVLLESPDVADFSNGNIIQGTLTGTSFEVPSHTISDDQFYTLGFSTTPVSTTDLSSQNITFNVAPNPSNGQFAVKIAATQFHDFQLRIMDYSGKLISTEAINNIADSYQQTYDFSHLPSGIYFIQLSTEEGMTTHKLMID